MKAADLQADLWERVRSGDRQARDEAVQINLGLVRHVVRRFAASGLDSEDLFQLGCIGLVKAVDRYEPSLGIRFSTYAVPLIMGEIRCFLRDDGPLQVSRELKRVVREARRKEEELRSATGREPSLGELADALQMDRAELAAALDAAVPPVSLDTPAMPGEAGSPSIGECVAAADTATWDDFVALRAGLARLDPRLRRIVQLRFFEERTQREIGRLLRLSQVQISRLEKKALRTLRDFLQ